MSGTEGRSRGLERHVLNYSSFMTKPSDFSFRIVGFTSVKVIAVEQADLQETDNRGGAENRL